MTKRKPYKQPTWAVQLLYRENGVVEDICEHGVGHPNHDWLDCVGFVHINGIHGCCGFGCCSIPPTATKREIKRYVATYWLEQLNLTTKCCKCGRQPIEWHAEHYDEKSNSRISSLRTQGVSINKIKKELDRCIPVCRSCHMKLDGRLETLRRNQPNPKGSQHPPKECKCCHKLTKPMRNGLCVTCDNHHSRRRLRKTNSCDGCCHLEEHNGV